MPRIPEPSTAGLPGSLIGHETSLVDVVDNLLGKGVVVDGEVVLGLAGIDLIYLRLAALLAAADRVAKGLPAPAPAAPRDAGTGTTPRTEAGGAGDEAPRSDPASEGHRHGVELFDLPGHGGSDAGAGVHVRPAPDVPASSRERDAAVPPSRWNPDPEEVRKGVMKLVLALAEFIRQLLERQAIRRMEAGTLTGEETERLGTALSQLEDTLREMAERAGLDPEDVNLDLGPLGKLV